jgi:hypothetical protein
MSSIYPNRFVSHTMTEDGVVNKNCNGSTSLQNKLCFDDAESHIYTTQKAPIPQLN